MRLNNRVCIVTGGAAGIGRGIASELAKAGAAVVVADLNQDTGREVSIELRQKGYDCRFVLADVRRGDSIERLVKQVLSWYGRVDVLVNNAGITRFRPLLEMTEEEWDDLMAVDLKGIFLCTKQVLPIFLRQGKGVVINIASNHAVATLPNTEAYAAAKSAVVGFTKSLGLSFGAKGVRAVAVAPGFTDTPHVRHWLNESGDPEEMLHFVEGLHPLKRIAEPAEIGRIVAFLASDEAAWITSTLIVADGGLSSYLYHEKT